MVKRFLAALLVLLLLGSESRALPEYEQVRQAYVKSDSLLVDRHGEVLHELRTDPDRRRLEWMPLSAMSPALQDAVIEAEDKRFFSHAGVDYRALAAAMLQGPTAERLRGASTISMQVAGLLDPKLQARRGRRSLWQKARQAKAAWDLENTWTKQEILEGYLNLITFRGELQGIGAAARTLFGKYPHGLDRPEALVLAALIRAPNAPREAVSNRAFALGCALKWFGQGEALSQKIAQVFLGTQFLRPGNDLAPHVARSLLKGASKGATVSCTLEARTQRFGKELLDHHLVPLRAQSVRDGAILVAENRSGEVCAYVSRSGDPDLTRFVDGVRAKRQAGSTLKPFLYALAFDQRILTPASRLDDSPLDLAVLSGIYQPRNYDAQFRGLVSARTALASSLNVPAVRTLGVAGGDAFLRTLRSLGIERLNESADFYGPALALGSAEVSLWELVNAYRTLANEGRRSALRLTPGRMVSGEPVSVFSPEAAFLVSDILSDREARSVTFGLENPLATRFWSAAKTGTTKDMCDNWCIGYSRDYTVGVWVGNFTGEPMWNVSGVTGAAPIWMEMMSYLHQDVRQPPPVPPPGVVKRRVHCTPAPAREECFIIGTEPRQEGQRIGQRNERILYPPAGTLIALDPDIPRTLQKVFFVAATNRAERRWVLNGVRLSARGKAVAWTPKRGEHVLCLTDEQARVLDQVGFKVRGESAGMFFPPQAARH